MAQNNRKSSQGTKRFANQESHEKCDRSCPICFEKFDNNCRETFTNCGHSFCNICLQRTLKIQPFCPLCRQYQGPDKQDKADSGSVQLDPSIPWNPQVVRAFYGMEEVNEKGRLMRTVHLSDGERTGIHVDPNVKINIDNNVNLIINGKRVRNPANCNQQ